MKQMTLAAAGFERYAKTTRRAVFLGEMEGVVPWPTDGTGLRAREVMKQTRVAFLMEYGYPLDVACEAPAPSNSNRI